MNDVEQIETTNSATSVNPGISGSEQITPGIPDYFNPSTPVVPPTTNNAEYIYIKIPIEYICVYHRILAMMADYGEEMLKDCKASCTAKNSDVIECFNMFNSAVAAKKLGKTKLAETIIKYIKAKINQIYKGIDNSTSFVFPVDDKGEIKAFISCGELPTFRVDAETGNLYKSITDEGVDEGFSLSDEIK